MTKQIGTFESIWFCAFAVCRQQDISRSGLDRELYLEMLNGFKADKRASYQLPTNMDGYVLDSILNML